MSFPRIVLTLGLTACVLAACDPYWGHRAMRYSMQDLKIAAEAKEAGDDTKALRFFEKAARTGHPMAVNALAKMHLHGRGTPVDPAKAQALLEGSYAKNSDQKSASAFLLAEALRLQGKDPRRQAALYEEALSGGQILAARPLAELHDRGEGVAIDPVKAFAYWRQAAEAGQKQAYAHVANGYLDGIGTAADTELGQAWAERAIAAGDIGMMTDVAEAHLAGTPPFAKDPARAADLLRRATDLGSRTAKGRYASMLLKGDSIPADPETGLRLLREEAELSPTAFALHRVASVYLYGPQAVRDEAEGVDWLERAAAAGNLAAMGDLGRRKIEGRGTPQDSESGLALAQAAADQDNANGMLGLGIAYAKGLGVARDLASARTWLERAVAAGSAAAKPHLDRLAAATSKQKGKAA